MENIDLYKLIPYWFEGIPYSLPTNSSKKLKRHIQAAILAYNNKDYHYEHITDILNDLPIDNIEDESNQSDIAQDQIIGIIQSYQKILNILLMNSGNSEGVLQYCLSMSRLVSTFESCLILLRNGYFIESSPLIRLIFEQIAWAYSIFEEGVDFTKKSDVTSAIKYLNELKAGASKIYGQYSKEAHLDIAVIGQYISFDTENNKIGVKQRSGIESMNRSVDLVFICQLYILSVEKVLTMKNLLNSKIQDIVLHNDNQSITVEEFISTSKIILSMSAKLLSGGKSKHPFNNSTCTLKFTDTSLI